MTSRSIDSYDIHHRVINFVIIFVGISTLQKQLRCGLINVRNRHTSPL